MDYRLVIAACLLCVGCGAPAELDTDEVDGWAASVAGTAADTPPVPDDTPTPGGKCQTCNGTGKVGDGRVFSMCLDCDGKGVIESTPEDTQGVTSTPDVQEELPVVHTPRPSTQSPVTATRQSPVLQRRGLLRRVFGRRGGGLLRVTGSGSCAGGTCQ